MKAAELPGRRAVGLPFTHIAEQELGRAIAANIVMLGALQELTGVVTADQLADAVRRRMAAKIVELNLRALELGRERAGQLNDFLIAVDLYEYEAKEILAATGLAVPRSRLARSVAEAEHLAAEVGLPLVVKAQVTSGGRGKAGGVRLVALPGELHAATSEILGMTIADKPVVAVLLEGAVEIAAEFYLAITLERSERRPLLLFSCQGGVEIEQVAASDPAALQRCLIDPLLGLCDHQVRSLAKRRRSSSASTGPP